MVEDGNPCRLYYVFKSYICLNLNTNKILLAKICKDLFIKIYLIDPCKFLFMSPRIVRNSLALIFINFSVY